MLDRLLKNGIAQNAGQTPQRPAYTISSIPELIIGTIASLTVLLGHCGAKSLGRVEAPLGFVTIDGEYGRRFHAKISTTRVPLTKSLLALPNLV